MSLSASPHRWRLHRAGLLNIWQYDNQVFDFADGRLLLRGTNGAGKSKTLEMLLPFLLDADRSKMDASGKRGTALSWLMLDGFDGTSRTGYLWLQLRRTDEDGKLEHLTLGLGLRASGSTKTVNLWCFVQPGELFSLEDEAGAPLTAPACREAVTAAGGEFFDSPRAYKSAVGRRLFGLDDAAYDELLRLLYWLRSPQVGESVEVSQLDRTLSESLPELDKAVVDAAATSLDELQEFGEQVERRERASDEVQKALSAYQRYASGEVLRRVRGALDATAHHASTTRALARAESVATTALEQRAQAADRFEASTSNHRAATTRLHELETSKEARDLEALEQMRHNVETLARVLAQATAAVSAAVTRREQAGQRLTRQGEAVERRRRELEAEVDATALRGVGIAALGPVDLDQLDSHAAELSRVESAAGAALAAVEVCLQALAEWEKALSAQERADEQEALAAQRVESAALAADQAEAAVDDALRALESSVTEWLKGAPVEGSPEEAEQASDWAATVTGPLLTAFQQEVGRQQSLIADLAVQSQRLGQEREQVSSERDPAPPLPALPRDARDGVSGLPLWRVVDVAAGVAEDDLASVEAALQSSGLLDALVLADGRVIGQDVFLTAGQAVEGPSLADVLRPAVEESGPVSADVVAGVLRRISLTAEPAVRTDGSWSLGPLEGRATKPRAQYLGVVAREAERARRLALLDEQLAALALQAAEAEVARDEASARVEELASWRDAAPRPTELHRARTVVQERRRALDKETNDHRQTEERAVRARGLCAQARQKLDKAAVASGLPTDRNALQDRQSVLRDVRRAAVTAGRRLQDLRRDLDQFAKLVEEDRVAAEDLAAAEDQAHRARTEAETASRAYDARREALSATQLQLQQALKEASDDVALAQAEIDGAHEAQLLAVERATKAADAVEAAETAMTLAQERLASAERAAAALRDAAGLLSSVVAEELLEASWTELLAAVEGLAVADANAVHAAYRDLAASAAGHLQPKLHQVADGLFVFTGTDDLGEAPLAVLAHRLRARVEADRALLTKQQREVCERHLLGELGETLRVRRHDAEKLVGHMNQLLENVRTSQGIRVRLDWRLREDLAGEARETVRLLDRPIGSLVPEQRERLLGLLSELIEAARREDPDAGYAEHLRNALDYRSWSAFGVRIRRSAGADEERLTRRTALSQGEQKVVCYLPLFAAAAAHFSSLAIEAPLAPRFVLLDDAFPKIDVKTHPILFGLLVDLELDWLITSERLWADCATVPAAAVYEVIRSPTERGVLPFKHLWDGRRLTAVSA